MNILIVVAHPEPSSFTAAIAEKIKGGIAASGGHNIEFADLVRENFDPRMTHEDLLAYRRTAPPPEAIVREQERFDRADAVAIVFPIYWWSLPALLKGWIDRVFTHGWAYGFDETGALTTRLRERPIHLVGVGAGDEPGYEKHGYRKAMITQIEYGIFSFCGIKQVRTTLMLEDEGPAAKREEHIAAAHEIGRGLTQSWDTAPVAVAATA